MKVSYQDIKNLLRWGQDDPTIVEMVKNGVQPSVYPIGFYTPSQANWSYIVGLIDINGQAYEVVTCFGAVEGGRAVHLPRYNQNITGGNND